MKNLSSDCFQNTIEGSQSRGDQVSGVQDGGTLDADRMPGQNCPVLLWYAQFGTPREPSCFQ